MADPLILWDIDGTLVSCGPVGREALEAGAKRAAGLTTVPQVEMAGKTDPQIIGEILVEAGLDMQEIQTVLPSALNEAEAALAGWDGRLKQVGRVHSGVRDLLDSLHQRNVRQTLVTGNIAVNALQKIRAFGLDAFFDFEVGAYGSDDADRDCLVPICLERVRELRDEIYPDDQVWVIGDTGNDLRCAQVAGVRCLLVGTGHAGFDAVRNLDADVRLENLSDTDLVLGILLNGRLLDERRLKRETERRPNSAFGS